MGIPTAAARLRVETESSRQAPAIRSAAPQYTGGGGYGDPAPRQPTKVPLALSIIGIVCWFVSRPRRPRPA